MELPLLCCAVSRPRPERARTGGRRRRPNGGTVIYCHIIGTHLGNSGRERGEERETFHFLRKTYEKWIRVRSKEREGGGRELRIAGEYRVRCRSSTMRMAGWERAWAPCQIVSLSCNTRFQVRQIRLSESEMRPKTNGVISNTKQSHRSHPRLRSSFLVLSYRHLPTGSRARARRRAESAAKISLNLLNSPCPLSVL